MRRLVVLAQEEVGLEHLSTAVREGRSAAGESLAGSSGAVESGDIKSAVARHYQLSVDILSAKTRRKEAAHARQTAMYLSRKLTGSSLKEIGTYFGGRDHTTVIHACQAIEELINKDSEFQGVIETIKKSI